MVVAKEEEKVEEGEKFITLLIIPRGFKLLYMRTHTHTNTFICENELRICKRMRNGGEGGGKRFEEGNEVPLCSVIYTRTLVHTNFDYFRIFFKYSKCAPIIHTIHSPPPPHFSSIQRRHAKPTSNLTSHSTHTHTFSAASSIVFKSRFTVTLGLHPFIQPTPPPSSHTHANKSKLAHMDSLSHCLLAPFRVLLLLLRFDAENLFQRL